MRRELRRGVATVRAVAEVRGRDSRGGDLLGEVLEAFGNQVHVATSGPDALASIERCRPDAAVLDIGLPVMDGYEVARLLKVRIPDIKLIALTGYGQADDRERSRSAGFHAHLVKPVSMTDVMGTLDQLLG